MTQIQNILSGYEVPQIDDHSPASPRVPLDERMWPAELVALLDNPRAVKLEIPGLPTLCPNCGGAGMMMIYVWTRGPFQQPTGGKVKWLEGEGISRGWYQGETHTAPCPVCQEDGWREYLRANCGLHGPDLEVTLSSFLAGGIYFEKEPALLSAQMTLALNRSPGGFLTFCGQPGRGKSHILKSLVNGFRGIGIYSRYMTAADLIGEIRDHFGDDRGGTLVEAAIAHYKRVRVLAVDELSELQLTDWARQTLFRLLDSRYTDRGSLLTVLAMKGNPEELPDDLAYLASRISGGLAVEVSGPDMRGVSGLRARAPL